MLAAQGITRDNIDEAELNNSQSAERIADGQLDAYFYAAGTPVAAMIQLDNTKGMDLYSFTDEEVVESNKAVPYYVPSTIKSGTYLVTSSDQPEELIYEITKALWSDTTRKLLDNGHAKGKVILLETALKGVEGLKVPLHPGAEKCAEKFYKEAGLIK
jgi:TRAP transporter TAXI family solute receptor